MYSILSNWCPGSCVGGRLHTINIRINGNAVAQREVAQHITKLFSTKLDHRRGLS